MIDTLISKVAKLILGAIIIRSFREYQDVLKISTIRASQDAIHRLNHSLLAKFTMRDLILISRFTYDLNHLY